MITRLRRRLGPCPAARAADALAAYESHATHPQVLAALFGYQQVADRDRGLVDGPQRLAVVTADTILLSHPGTGVIDRETPLAQLAAYLIDPAGRFVIRLDTWQGPSRVGGFRPLAAPDLPLSTPQAAALFVRQAIAAWETRIGRPFINTWTTRSTDELGATPALR